MAGIVAATAAGVAIGVRYGAEYGPIGLSGLALSVTGGGLIVAGARRTDEAVRVYNEQADASGGCTPVW
jgi:hypothetical protein